MNLVTISGSGLEVSSNSKLLQYIASNNPNYSFKHFDILELPLFKVALDSNPLPVAVVAYRKQICDADALIISTPEYLFNLPAVLKNALEWLSSSGELYNKKVLAISFTPNPPRGEKAMLSLSNSLQALNSNVVCTLALYQDELMHNGIINPRAESIELLREALKLI